jgi:photosynthetic reaction center H subunit
MLRSGEAVQAPAAKAAHAAASQPPSGNPMLDGIGPAAYAARAETPDLTAEGEHKIVPLRVAQGFTVAEEDPDPRGMMVIAADGKSPGAVREIWIDRSEPQIRYLEIDGPRPVMLPINFARIDKGRRLIRVASLLAHQFAQVPAIASPESITLREEDRITSYFGGGTLYAEPARAEPLI